MVLNLNHKKVMGARGLFFSGLAGGIFGGLMYNV